ncbi:transcription elongation factor GreA [Spirochaetia bacterium]|nr:transcription elongation factor GreA [Spirochaetia bacterium]GHU32651.1 transcription elongation factor GreA [Spirochaetia bacterium]
MSENTVKNVQEMLNMEKWTRSTISNYSTNQFKELDDILKDLTERTDAEELKKLCDDHLNHTKNSIIALYLSGMIALSRQVIDDSAITMLIDIFVDNRKWNVVKYLCERILEHGESKFALRTLADFYKNDHQEESLIEVWERIIRIDPDEADIAKILAEHFEKNADLDSTVGYFKKALHRYIVKQLWTNVQEIWEKLLEYCPEDLDFFLHLQKKIAKTFGEEKAVLLLQDVYASCRSRGDINTALFVLKLILEYNDQDLQSRKEITDCFRIKYAGHSQLEYYIRISNLSQNYRNIHDAITDFEKHIAFDEGNYVFHRTWGVGRIVSVQGDKVLIDFAKKKGHNMSLKMAVDALQTLSCEHIWVLKATWKREKLHDKIKEDTVWALKMMIASFDNICDMKRIKAELVPSILDEKEWTPWSSKAREILKSDPDFGVSPDSIDLFTVKEHTVTIQEKLYNEFKAQKKFFKRVSIFRSFLEKKDLDSEYFTEMFAYFTGFLKPGVPVNEEILGSYLLVNDVIIQYPYLGPINSLNFISIWEDIRNDISRIFLELKDRELRKSLITNIKISVPEWPDIFIHLFPDIVEPALLKYLTDSYADKLTDLVISCFEKYRDYREAVVWFFKNASDEPWYKKAGISYEKQIITLIHILNLTYREIENHRETTDNRRINNQVKTLFFKNRILESIIDTFDTEMIVRIFTLLNDVKDLDSADKMRLRSRIADKYPEIKFTGDSEKTYVTRGLMVTKSKYEEKKRQLVRLMEEEIPANSKEIEFALSLGDLRENAEYKAAKERQEQLNSTVSRLKTEIDRAQLFEPTAVNTAHVSFGTKVTMFNTTIGTEEEYTILGPWESDPDNKILSYLSPFAKELLNKKPGEQFEYSMTKTSYVIKTITIAAG